MGKARFATRSKFGYQYRQPRSWLPAVTADRVPYLPPEDGSDVPYAALHRDDGGVRVVLTLTRDQCVAVLTSNCQCAERGRQCVKCHLIDYLRVNAVRVPDHDCKHGDCCR